MIWPFSELARLQLQNAILTEAIRNHERAWNAAVDREVYWRTRYERLADSVLFKSGDINSPVHVEPRTDKVTSLGSRVMRAAGLAGNPEGIDFKKHGVQVEVVQR